MKIYLTGFGRLPQKNALARLCAKVCDAVPKLRGPGEIHFILVSSKKIKQLHKQFLDDPSDTDVITFQYPRASSPGRSTGRYAADLPFGDVYISQDAARAQAKKGGYPPIQEIAFLMVHGLLHLSGHDDHAPSERRRMLGLQGRLIREFAPRFAPPE